MVKKEEQEKLKLHQQKQKVEERNAILAIQKDWKKKKEEEQKFVSAEEKEMLRMEWEKQSELAKLKEKQAMEHQRSTLQTCLLYTSPSPRDQRGSRMPSSA